MSLNPPPLTGITRLLIALLADRLGHRLRRTAQSTLQWRPLFHFTPPAGWMNDPNGLVYFAERYHLFYQYISYSTTHPTAFSFLHHMPELCWGHASSPDLLHWELHPPALQPKPDGTDIPFSGSAVVKQEYLAAIFTQVNHGTNQRQSLAFANPQVSTLNITPGSPVLPNPGLKDFRDPKVTWYTQPDGVAGYWVMALAAGERLKFYRSEDLAHWQFLSNFPPSPQRLFEQMPAAWGPVAECPDLFDLPTPDGKRLWALTYCQGWWPGSRPTLSFYRLGTFDGVNFIPSDNGPRRLDYGPDYYATQTWANTREQCIATAWMNNWLYAEHLPTHPWRGQLSFPRQLRLEQTDEGYSLAQWPIAGLETLALPEQRGPALDVQIELETGTADCRGIHLRAGDSLVEIAWRRASQTLTLDRTQAAGGLGPSFASRYAAPLRLAQGERLALRLLVDRSSVEVFAQRGLVTLSALVFPSGNTWAVEEI